MLSSVLRSDTAVRVNIEIMRAFVRLRRAALVSRQIMGLVEELSKRVDSHDWPSRTWWSRFVRW